MYYNTGHKKNLNIWLKEEDDGVNINRTLNDLLVGLFRSITTIEEQSICTGEYRNMTTNDMHVIEAIGRGVPRNMTAVARALGVTTGTVTISMNNLVKKGYVQRVRSEEDRRVVLVSLTSKGKKAFEHHERFHEEMIRHVVEMLDENEKRVLEKSLEGLNRFFQKMQQKSE